MKFFKRYYWWLPFLFHSMDANAWGLITHLYYAHSLVWAMPLLDPRFRRAIKQFPDLVMAGACIPDLAVVSEHFAKTHQWQLAHELLSSAKTEEEAALAIGFASHLYVDVIAHNHFVPAHEARWRQSSQTTSNALLQVCFKRVFGKFKLSKWVSHSAIIHIGSEWAMDAYLEKLVETSPTQLLKQHKGLIIQLMTPHFKCDASITLKAINRLSYWDNVLRIVKLPNMIYWLARRFDKKLVKHFIYYIAKTQTAMQDFGQTLDGHNPNYAPELKTLDAHQLRQWRAGCLAHLHLMHPKPIKYFTTKT